MTIIINILKLGFIACSITVFLLSITYMISEKKFKSAFLIYKRFNVFSISYRFSSFNTYGKGVWQTVKLLVFPRSFKNISFFLFLFSAITGICSLYLQLNWGVVGRFGRVKGLVLHLLLETATNTEIHILLIRYTLTTFVWAWAYLVMWYLVDTKFLYKKVYTYVVCFLPLSYACNVFFALKVDKGSFLSSSFSLNGNLVMFFLIANILYFIIQISLAYDFIDIFLKGSEQGNISKLSIFDAAVFYSAVLMLIYSFLHIMYFLLVLLKVLEIPLLNDVIKKLFLPSFHETWYFLGYFQLIISYLTAHAIMATMIASYYEFYAGARLIRQVIRQLSLFFLVILLFSIYKFTVNNLTIGVFIEFALVFSFIVCVWFTTSLSIYLKVFNVSYKKSPTEIPFVLVFYAKMHSSLLVVCAFYLLINQIGCGAIVIIPYFMNQYTFFKILFIEMITLAVLSCFFAGFVAFREIIFKIRKDDSFYRIIRFLDTFQNSMFIFTVIFKICGVILAFNAGSEVSAISWSRIETSFILSSVFLLFTFIPFLINVVLVSLIFWDDCDSLAVKKYFWVVVSNKKTVYSANVKLSQQRILKIVYCSILLDLFINALCLVLSECSFYLVVCWSKAVYAGAQKLLK